MRFLNRGIFFSAALLCAAATLDSEELTVNPGSTPYAPLDISKKDDALVPLSREQRRDLIKEFKGLVAMGLQNLPYESWSWRTISDCYEPERPGESWSYKCEIITGQGNGYYYFYRGDHPRVSTLQRVEVRLQTSDRQVLEEIKPSLRSLFGHPGIIVKRSASYRSVGPVRHWNTGRDVADLFLDGSQHPRGLVRFVWNRGTLARTQQAFKPDVKTDN